MFTMGFVPDRDDLPACLEEFLAGSQLGAGFVGEAIAHSDRVLGKLQCVLHSFVTSVPPEVPGGTKHRLRLPDSRRARACEFVHGSLRKLHGPRVSGPMPKFQSELQKPGGATGGGSS